MWCACAWDCCALQALPALWLYHHVAVSVCRDTGHTVHANILRLQSLTQLHYYQEALDTHSKLLSGSGLPQPCGTTPTDKHTDTHWVSLRTLTLMALTHHNYELQVLGGFSNSIPLTDARNMKCVRAMLERSLSSMLTELYGPVHLQHLSLATAELYTALAEGLSPLHSSTALWWAIYRRVVILTLSDFVLFLWLTIRTKYSIRNADKMFY